MSPQSGSPAEQAKPASQRPPEPPGRRRGISPIAGFLLVLLIVLIAIPTVFWLADRSEANGGKKPVLVASHPIAAFSLLAPGDVHIEMRDADANQAAIELPVTATVALKGVAEGAILSKADVAAVPASAHLPEDPVVIRAAEPASLPAAAPVGGRVTIYGVLGKQRFTVLGILLSRDKDAVFLVSRNDAKNFGTVLASGKFVAIVDVPQR